MDDSGFDIGLLGRIAMTVGILILLRFSVKSGRKRVLERNPTAKLPEAEHPKGLIPLKALRELSEHNVWLTMSSAERRRQAFKMLAALVIAMGLVGLFIGEWLMPTVVGGLLLLIVAGFTFRPASMGRIASKALTPWLFVVLGVGLVVTIVLIAIQAE